jgi:hypothetical protein
VAGRLWVRDNAWLQWRIRTVMKTTAGLVSLLIVLMATACGSHPSAKVVRGVIEIRSGVCGPSLRHSVVGITVGSSAAEVRRKLGATCGENIETEARSSSLTAPPRLFPE